MEPFKTGAATLGAKPVAPEKGFRVELSCSRAAPTGTSRPPTGSSRRRGNSSQNDAQARRATFQARRATV